MTRRILDPKTCLSLVFFVAITPIAALAVPAKVIETVPENGQQDVNPRLRQIRIRFDQDMNRQGYSVCGSGPTFPKTIGKARWINKRTFVMPVRLEPNHDYELYVNSQSYKNFKNLRGQPAIVYPVKFRTGSGGHESSSPITIDKPFEELPVGWIVQQSFVAPQNQTLAIGKKLGGRITTLSNTILLVRGQRLQVNILDCQTLQDAETIHKTLLEMKGDPALCLKTGKQVVEFIANDIRLIRKAHYVLGFRPREVTYRVSFDLATVERADYMSFNRLSNLLWALAPKRSDPQAVAQIAHISKKFRFGDSIRLRSQGNGKSKNTYTFTPKPEKSDPLPNGTVKYSFQNLPTKVDVPYVSVVATVKSSAFAFTPTDRKADTELLAANSFWPCDDKEIVALAKKITKGMRTDEEKTYATLEWLMPGKNIKFESPIEGSRYGVKQTISQGYGHCWDFSDLFVTLCRASGVPCRQVGGWLYEQEGHIWAEVLLKGQGWIQVDATTGMACGSDYIPYLTTEDGEMPFVYVSMPTIRLSAETELNGAYNH